MSRAAIPIDSAFTDPNLLGAGLGDSASWAQWLAVLRAAFALPMSDEDRRRFHLVAGDRTPPSHRVDELWCVLARRSGKTRTAAAVATYLATIVEHRLAPGEVGYVLLLASSRSQASVAFNYIVGLIETSPFLRQQIETVTADEVRLKGNIVIGVHTASHRTIRGRSLIGCIFDECAFWRDEASATPDIEVYRAVIPALAAAGGMLIGISTGYRRIGLLHQKHRDHFGQSTEDVLVVQGDTATFNPLLDRKVIERAMKNDPEAAASEWLGGWRDDLSSFLDDATIDAAIDQFRPIETPPRPGIIYHAFSDASGGRHDAFTVAIGHREKDHFIVDVVRGKAAPFDPQLVTTQFAALLKEYGISRVRGDNYAASWVETSWRDNGIKFERSELAKSQLYLEALPLFTRNVVRLPNDPRLTRELRLLERRATRSGRDAVDHGRNGTDDYANSCCGLLQSLTHKSRYNIAGLAGIVSDDENGSEAWRRQRLQHFIFSGGQIR